MSADTEKSKTKVQNTKTRNTWVIALLVSMAVNGLLIGLLLSKQVKPNIVAPELPPSQNRVQIMPNNLRHLVRTLSPERRKQVMTTAMKNLKTQDAEHPRRLFKKLRLAKLKTMRLMKADELDAAAIEKSMVDIRDINHRLAVSGDALMIEVLAQLSPEERKAAREALGKRKMRNRKSERH